jgi:hypothetical protein
MITEGFEYFGGTEGCKEHSWVFGPYGVAKKDVVAEARFVAKLFGLAA